MGTIWMKTEHPKKPPMTTLELFKHLEEIIPPEMMTAKTVRDPANWQGVLWLHRFPSRRASRELFAAFAGQPIQWDDAE